MLNLSHVAAFVAVVETGNFHVASQRLGVSQPTVSQHLQKLEEDLGAALVLRTRGGCSATPKGRLFLPYARALLATEARARATLEGRSLTIGAGSNIGIYLLPAELRRLRALSGEAPDLEMRIGANPDVAEWLENGELDLALTEWWDGRPGFEARPWRRERLVLIMAPDHPWAGRGRVALDELFGVPLLGGERGTGTGTLLRRTFGATAGMLGSGPSLGSTEAVKRAVRAGLGVSLVMESTVCDEVRSGTLAAAPVEGAELAKELWLVLPANLPPTAPAVRLAERLLDGGTAVPA
ncbi:LysR family transcriptional regulator [Azospirillum sp. A39]|uniref:LysR family transcriptional regulator n=1 Tax=Azospirillum sp. A39 TaxID=3462279 RepID=UPI004045DB65